MSALDRVTKPGPVRALAGFALGAAVLFGLAPAVLSTFRLELLGQYLCYAIVAVGIGLAWGRGGMLTLGQGVFFGLGGYIMAMHMTLSETDEGLLPDFMLGVRETLPAVWEPFRSPVVALPAVVVVPMVVAFGLGSLVFRRRVRGPYFAILSQALAAAMAVLLVGQADWSGGTNGITGITEFFGYDKGDPVNKQMIFMIVAAMLLLAIFISRQLMFSRYGELLVAVRDSEERVRFLGYDPATIKIVAYSVAAGMAGLAGALFVAVTGFITPSQVGIVFSIEFVIGVAIGGRASLLGPAIGAVAVGFARSELSTQWPSSWSYVQGLLFVVVVAFLPGGLASLFKRRQRQGPVPPDGEPASVELPSVEPETPAATSSKEVTA